MPVASADLDLQASNDMPIDDVSTTGGVQDALRRPVFAQLAANDTIEAISDNAGDTQNLTIRARDAAGNIVTETKVMNGTTFISLSSLGTVERILSAELASNAVGIVTIRRTSGATLIEDIPVGSRGFMILFQDSASDPGSTKVRYEKMFWENKHGTLSLTNAKVTLTADPSGKLTFDLEDAVDDNNSAANRLTEPTGLVGAWIGTGTSIDVPGDGNLDAGEAIGTWLRQSLGVGDAPIKNTFDVKLEGQST